MDEKQQLIDEINDLTLRIEQDYPELYLYLDENPITLPNGGGRVGKEMNARTLSDYLNSLKSLLQHYRENQPE